MLYFIEGLSLHGTDKVDINEENFENIKKSKEIISNFHKFIDNYRIVVQSYRNIEKAKHEAELDHILYANHGYESGLDNRVTLSSPIIGYLSSSYYFIHSTKKIISETLPENYDSFTSFNHEVYNLSKGYRFIEALRNYVQHRDLPIHKTTFHNFYDDKNNLETSSMVTSLSLFSNKSELENDAKFKKPILKDLPDNINIIYSIRCHMEGIWKQFEYLKEPLINIGEKSKSVITDEISNFEEKTGKRTTNLHAIKQKDNKDIIENVPLVIEWYEASRESLKKIGNLNNLHKRYATGKIIQKHPEGGD